MEDFKEGLRLINKSSCTISKVLAVVTVLGLYINNFASLVYVIYLWANTDIGLAMSIWKGFTLWISVIISGFILIIVATILEYWKNERNFQRK